MTIPILGMRGDVRHMNYVLKATACKSCGVDMGHDKESNAITLSNANDNGKMVIALDNLEICNDCQKVLLTELTRFFAEQIKRTTIMRLHPSERELFQKHGNSTTDDGKWLESVLVDLLRPDDNDTRPKPEDIII